MSKITNIFWKRTYLFVEYEANQAGELYIENQGKRCRFEQKQLDEGLFRAKINLCIAEGREMLGKGLWMMSLDGYQRLHIEDRVLNHIEDLSKVFRYDEDKAYIITFHVMDKEDGTLSLQMNCSYMRENTKPEQRMDRLFFFKKVLNFWYQIVAKIYPKNGKHILFMSENRAYMTGNLKAIYERLHERKLNEQYSIMCSFRNIFEKKQNPLEWIKIITKLAVSDYVFLEDYVPVLGFLKLDERTVIVQTWHAGFGFKSVGYGRFGLEGSPHPFHSCHRKYTYGLVGNQYLKEIYSEVFGIEKESLLATGMPRLSSFLNEEVKADAMQKLYEDMPFLKEKQVITFAPTYRGSNQKEAYYDMEKIDQEALASFCKKNNAIVLLKFHPFLKGQTFVCETYKEWLVDCSEYDLNELFYVTDVLITDYSSCFYDYILLNKPVLFYVYDEVSYAATRGVHRTVSKVAPGTVCHTFEEVLSCLEAQSYEAADVPAFMIDNCLINKKYTASDRVIDYVILKKKDLTV